MKAKVQEEELETEQQEELVTEKIVVEAVAAVIEVFQVMEETMRTVRLMAADFLEMQPLVLLDP